MKTTLALAIILFSAGCCTAAGFRVADDGAAGDGKTDDGPAIQKAVDAAIAAGAGSKVVFGPETYCLDWRRNASYQIALVGAKDIAIEGNGAVLVCHPRNSLISLKDCRGVVVNGFTVDCRIKEVIAPGVYAMSGTPAVGDRLTAFTPATNGMVEGLVVKSDPPDQGPGVQAYPPHAHVVDVTKPPYMAKGDGATDNTDALQNAFNENVGRHRVIYFPKGTYLVSRMLTWPKEWGGHQKWGFTILRGQERDATVIRLKDNTFTDAARPQAIMSCGGFGSADWFHNYVENLTFDVGSGNPGATALRFYSNNTGAVRDCRFTAVEGSGDTGLDLSHHDMNGPLLVKDCEVVGFRRGITTARAVNSQVFERITLRGQAEIGFSNEGQPVSIRGLSSRNAVPALGTYGNLLLVDATLAGTGNAARVPAIVNYNGGRIFLRDVKTSGYMRALADMRTPDFATAFRISGEDKPGSLGPDIAEYSSTPTTTAFPSPAGSLRLAIKETPAPVWEDPSKWAVVDAFGADPTADKDSTDAIQRAMNSGAATIFLPGSYKCSATITVRGKVRTIVGLGGALNYGKRDLVNFRIEDGDSPLVEIGHFGHLGGGVEIATRRAVVLRSLETFTLTGTAAAEGGEMFLEDVVGGDFRFRRQKVWTRQLNIENEGTHLTNNGGDLWVLGYKTERGGVLAHTLGGGRTEILGGFSYTTTAGKLAPMFVNEDSSVWAYFTERCFNGDPFTSLIRETRSGETRIINPDPATTAPYSGRRP